MARRATYSGTIPAGQTTVLSLQLTTEDNIVGIVWMDQAGSVNIQQSVDGSNWDLSNSTPIVASTGLGISQSVFGPFVQITITNSSGSTANCRAAFRPSSAGDS